MSVIELLTRVEPICNKKDRYGLEKHKEFNISGDDAFTRLCLLRHRVRSSDIRSGNGFVEGYGQNDESQVARYTKEALTHLSNLVESRLPAGVSIFDEIGKLMSQLSLVVDFSEFSRFYEFVFFLCRERGQKSITVPRAISAWRIVLAGRFRLLNQWCEFVEKNQRHNITGDTSRQVLAFSRCVHENLEGYDPEGAWPVLVDDFVEHMYSFTTGEASNNWTALMDKFLTSEDSKEKKDLREKMLRLVDIYTRGAAKCG